MIEMGRQIEYHDPYHVELRKRTKEWRDKKRERCGDIKQYEQRMSLITVRPSDDIKEYARQYYHVVIKGRDKAPPKQKRGK